jgi:16S rRNA C1402 (ribose-2'-O) methylase RsmI
LSKRFEEVALGRAQDLAETFAREPKGEITLVIGSARAESGEAEELAVAAVTELIAAGLSRRRAVELVAKLAGVAKNRLYDRSL